MHLYFESPDGFSKIWRDYEISRSIVLLKYETIGLETQDLVILHYNFSGTPTFLYYYLYFYTAYTADYTFIPSL